MINPEDHVGLVHTIARGFQHLGEFDDLVSVGTLGMVEAARRFDPDKGFTFSTYAASYIRAYIKNYLNVSRYRVHVPEKISQQVIRGEMTPYAVMARRAEQVVKVVERHPEYAEDLGGAVVLQCAPTQVAALARVDIERLFRVLTPRQRQAMALRYGLNGSSDPMTMEEAGRVMGISHQRVEQLVRAAMSRLRQAAGAGRAA